MPFGSASVMSLTRCGSIPQFMAVIALEVWGTMVYAFSAVRLCLESSSMYGVVSMSLLYGVVERARVDSRWMKTTFFFSVSLVFWRWVFRGAGIGLASTARFLILACSISLMTTLATGSLENDLLTPPASTGNERKMSPKETTQVTVANSHDVAQEPEDSGPLGLP